MRTLEHLSPQQQERIARETMEIYAPIGQPPGDGEGQDGAGGSFDPLPGPRGQPRRWWRRCRRKRKVSDFFITEIRKVLEARLESRESPARSRGGFKHLYSIYKKLRVQGIDVSQIYDYVAFRIITPSVKDCYAALGTIHSVWRPVPGAESRTHRDAEAQHVPVAPHLVMTDKGQPFEVQIRIPRDAPDRRGGIAAH